METGEALPPSLERAVSEARAAGVPVLTLGPVVVLGVTPGKPSGLLRKMAEVLGDVERVPKNGRNAFHGYDYATEADIVAAVRRGLSARKVAHFSALESFAAKELQLVDKSGRQKTEFLITAWAWFCLADGDSGEMLFVRFAGQGQDPGDKALYKALTGASKYFHLKTWLIPTGDDPEDDTDEVRGRGGGQSGRQRAQAEAREAPRQQPVQQPRQQPTPEATTTAPAAHTPASAVGFGPLKGTPISELSDKQIGELVDVAHEKLAANPTATWARAMRDNLAALEAEAALRARVTPQAQPTPEAQPQAQPTPEAPAPSYASRRTRAAAEKPQQPPREREPGEDDE